MTEREAYRIMQGRIMGTEGIHGERTDFDRGLRARDRIKAGPFNHGLTRMDTDESKELNRLKKLNELNEGGRILKTERFGTEK